MQTSLAPERERERERENEREREKEKERESFICAQQNGNAVLRQDSNLIEELEESRYSRQFVSLLVNAEIG